MIEQSEIVTEFVDDSLMLFRLEIFKDATVITVNLEERLKFAIEKLKGFALTKNVIIKSYSESIDIQANPVDIDKMFKNLIENAIKYNYENGRIDISL